MYKIFIDTNIFLDFYRYNNNDKISELLAEFKKYKKYFINTEQSSDEFSRNRQKTIHEFIETLKNQISPLYVSNFLVSIDGFDDYIESVRLANKNTNSMISKCEELILNTNKDPVYHIYSNFCTEVFCRTSNIIDRAIKRKYVGNPPTSNKYTCCDEIIWETLLEYCHHDLIIVTRDKTFRENFSFLKAEYCNKTGKDLKVVEAISDAIRWLGRVPSAQLENIENSIILEKELSYGEVFHNSTSWVSIIYDALEALGGVASLNQIYQKSYEIISNNYPEKLANRNIEATIRGVLQRYCSNSTAYINKADLFQNIKSGVWAIKKEES